MKTRTLLQRELQEYQGSLLKAPIVVSAALILLMLLSVILANRVAFIGEGVTYLMMKESETRGINVTISLDDDVHDVTYEVREESTNGDPVTEEEWNFSREWTFKPDRVSSAGSGDGVDLGVEQSALNLVLHALNAFFLLVMLVVTVYYLLGTLYQDRKDRSILFWKSMPVGELHEVASKMMVASLLVPLIFVAVSTVTQLAYVLLTMLLVWRMDSGDVSLVLDNVDFTSLFSFQLGAMFHWILWVAPVYGWFLLASAASRRSPFLLAFGIPLLVIFAERVFLGTTYVAESIARHLPTLVIDSDDGEVVGYGSSAYWASADYLGMLLGLAMAAAMLWGASWLRRNRFEI